MPGHRIFKTPFAAVYPLYVEKAKRKGRNRVATRKRSMLSRLFSSS